MTLYGRVHVVNFARKLTVTSIFFLIPLHFLALGFSGWQIGAVISAFAVAPLIVSFPVGWINDRLAISGAVRGGLAAVAAIFVVIAYARSFPVMAAAFLALGIANNILDISLNSLYYKDETAIDQNRKYGTFVFWLALGPALGVFGGGWLSRAADFRVMFLVFAGIMAVVFLGVRGFDYGKFHAVPFREYRRNLTQKNALLFMVFIFILATHWGVEGTVYSPYLAKAFGLDGFSAAIYISAGLLAMSAAAFFVGLRKHDARANRRLFIVAMLLSGLGSIGMIQDDVRVSLLFRLAHDAGDGAIGVLCGLTISRLFDLKAIGGSAGVLVAIQISGQMLGAMVYSPLGFRAGLHLPFLIAGVVLLLNGIYGAVIFRKLEC
jgi:MFS family permease